jgi:hypothetical protein
MLQAKRTIINFFLQKKATPRNIKKDGMERSRNLLPELGRGVRATSGTGFARLPCDFLSTLLFLPGLPGGRRHGPSVAN